MPKVIKILTPIGNMTDKMFFTVLYFINRIYYSVSDARFKNHITDILEKYLIYALFLRVAWMEA